MMSSKSNLRWIDMVDLNSIINNPNFGPIVFIIFLAIFLFFIIMYLVNEFDIWYYLYKKEKAHSSSKAKFFNSLRGGLSKGLINDLNSVELIYEGSIESDFHNFEDLAKLLKSFMPVLYSDMDLKLDDALLIKWDLQIKDIIKKLEDKSRFSGLDSAERSLMRDASSFIDEGNKVAAKGKLFELSAIIVTKDKAFKRDLLINRIVAFTTILGFILAVWQMLFG
jgi:hypothetical protein